MDPRNYIPTNMQKTHNPRKLTPTKLNDSTVVFHIQCITTLTRLQKNYHKENVVHYYNEFKNDFILKNQTETLFPKLLTVFH